MEKVFIILFQIIKILNQMRIKSIVKAINKPTQHKHIIIGALSVRRRFLEIAYTLSLAISLSAMISVSVLGSDSEFVDFNTLEEGFHIHTPQNIQKMSIDEFIERVETNSINLAKSQALTKSLHYEGKVARAWNSPYVEAEVDRIKSPSGGSELEHTIWLKIAPRLPWVTYTLAQSYKNKILRAEKSYELTKNLALITAKRLYLDYLILKEQHQIYTARYENAKNQLQISQVQYSAGRISKSQYLFFKSDFLATKVALKNSHNELLNALNALKVILGITLEDSDIEVEALNFAFVKIARNSLEASLNSNLYLQIVNLDIKDYQYSASIASQSRFDQIEIGGGIAKSESSDSALLSLKIPIPLTTQYGNKKAMYLALQSGSIREGEILKSSILLNATSYLDQLGNKKQLIALAKDNEDNRAKLSEIAKIGYEAGKTSAFEYLSVKNEHLNSMIATIQAKRDYIQTLAMLEETLSSVLNLGSQVLLPSAPNQSPTKAKKAQTQQSKKSESSTKE